MSHALQTSGATKPPGLADWLALAALALAQFMLILDVTVINVALPDLSRDLGLSAASAGWCW